MSVSVLKVAVLDASILPVMTLSIAKETKETILGCDDGSNPKRPGIQVGAVVKVQTGWSQRD